MKTFTTLVLAAMIAFGTTRAEAHHNGAAIAVAAIALGFAIAATRDNRYFEPTHFYGGPIRSHRRHWRGHHGFHHGHNLRWRGHPGFHRGNNLRWRSHRFH